MIRHRFGGNLRAARSRSTNPPLRTTSLRPIDLLLDRSSLDSDRARAPGKSSRTGRRMTAGGSTEVAWNGPGDQLDGGDA
jgi:hypothetical protein